MKTPVRPFFPPVEIPPDIFGLHNLPLLNLETNDERAKRIATVESGVAAAFRAAVDHLGEEEARRLFKTVMRRPKRGQGRSFAPDRDFRLLKEYDAAVLGGETVAALARRLRAEGTELGNSEGAIAAHIRKLLKIWKLRDRAAAVEARRWRMTTRNEPPALLSARGSKK